MSTASSKDNDTESCIVIIEPFYGGSHKKLIDLIINECKEASIKHEFYSLPSKKWHWRARTSALYFSEVIPVTRRNGILFASSVLNLAELVALRPDLANLHKLLYFHENQLVYPIRHQKERDFQYGYNQILSCLVSDQIIFNSYFNQNSFLSHMQSFLKMIPDHRPSGLADKISPRCRVLYFPINITKEYKKYETSNKEQLIHHATSSNQMRDQLNPSETNSVKKAPFIDQSLQMNENELLESRSDQKNGIILNPADKNTRLLSERPLHILWPHRWEHDKGPDLFFNTLFSLKNENFNFSLSVLGETFTDVPAIFHKAKDSLSCHIKNWGYLTNEDDYAAVLQEADVVVSTAEHEFFGVAMLEATHYGCYPLCPNKLVYPEIFPRECLYNTPNQLHKTLKKFCSNPSYVRRQKLDIKIEKFYWKNLKDEYCRLLKLL